MSRLIKTGVVLVVALFLLLPRTTTAQGECDSENEQTTTGCKPCPGDKWQNMASSKPSGPQGMPCHTMVYFTKEDFCEVTTGADCFNNDPLSVTSTDGDVTISEGTPALDSVKSSLGFSIPEVPFFRYFYPPDARAKLDFTKFDIGQVSQYYYNNKAPGIEFDTDFELFEWPGKTAAQHSEFLEDVTISAYGCVDDSLNPSTGKCEKKQQFIMLSFDRDNMKFLNYPCNAARGTNVVAFGNVRMLSEADDPDELQNAKGEPSQKIWLSHGEHSLHSEYTQPLFIRKASLDEMKPRDSRSDCTDMADLRTAMDFTFTTERLLVGMKCGIIVVANIFESSFAVTVAKLRKPNGMSSAFEDPINKISGSVCCADKVECMGMRNIVAAYSFNAERQPMDLKYLYLSYDLGETFEVKFVAPFHTLINLIKSLYGMYERWDEYYTFMAKNFDDDVFGDLRNFKVWKHLNVEEKELFIIQHASGLGGGVALEGFKRIHEVFCDKTIGPEESEDLTPDWVMRSINTRYKEFGADNKTECKRIGASCEVNFQEDLVVKELMKEYLKTYSCNDSKTDWTEKTKVETRKQRENETYCLEITSIAVVQEEQILVALCKVGFCNATESGPADCTTVDAASNLYAVFEIMNSPGVPVSYPVRRSKRIFECKLMTYGTLRGHENHTIQPELVQVPGSASIFIINCEKVVYFSGNNGRTLFNTAFYTKDTANNSTKYSRSYTLEDLKVPPAVAIDNRGQRIVLTFKNFYAHGAINYNREIRMLVGKIYERDLPGAVNNIDEGEAVAIPWYSNSDEITVSLAILDILGRDPDYKNFYKNRHAIRLVQIPISFYKDLVPFYSENLHLTEQARAKSLDFRDCETFAFSFGPETAKLDIGDSALVQVRVTDVNRLLPLGIFSNEEQSLLLNVELSNRSQGDPNDIIKHDWDVTITAIPHYRPKEESMVEAWFGSNYNNLYDYSSNVVLVNLPTVRCHVQPSGSVFTEIGCLGKTFVAHEDEHRPQCKNKFIKNEPYTLDPGMYDPELARYWLENNPNFVKRSSVIEGGLEITYDFSTFGCPLEPYREDDFAPDLRVLSAENRRNTSLGEIFNGNYVLIEIFGAKGFEYLFKVKDAGCKRRPQTKSSMVRDWIVRRQIFNISEGRMVNFRGALQGLTGNRIFDGKFVNDHLNIWNRVNYEPCMEEDGTELTEAENDQRYEIMNNRFSTMCADCRIESTNKLIWDANVRPKVFIFLAVAVDEAGTFCNHFTLFGVSLPKAHELEDLWSFLVFLIFVLLWIFLVLMGYWCRKSYLRKAYIYEARSERLKQAAWTVIYRYEKLLHENENKELETEITEFTQALNQKDRDQGYVQMQRDQGRKPENEDPKGKVEENRKAI